ncbi:DUF3718 domain-containing protein [Pseudoalteromonas tunicata]|jgi:hypothetical protein|uniref:Orphan protein n=3 Tax=Pseudoalteromonas tunicata TaxID=314281 RepID=A4CDU1_9GAMM|nr:DUF3718 domain-containing protein [Pseudoalteromonas tunicata]EAR27133.1 hypothetical protein PTD2_05665 [Pseudoalteromonas tunicata D2]
MKMKKLTIAVITSIATMATLSVNAASFEATNNSLETNLCMVAATGDTSQFYRTLRQQQREIRDVAKSVHCNGVSIAKFAKEHGATQIAKKLARFQ